MLGRFAQGETGEGGSKDVAGLSLATLKSRSARSRSCTASTCEIADREFVVFVGPSGCGKSTLLRMIAGLEDITAGEIAIDGRVVERARPEGPRHRHGVPGLRPLSAHDGVREHGVLAALPRHRPPGDPPPASTRRRASSTSSPISTACRASSRAASASASPWAAPSCAIPQVFLFDEPLSNLDAKLRVQMRTEIKRLRERAGARPRSTSPHDQVEAMTLADRIVILSTHGAHRADRHAGGRSTTGRPRPSSRASSARRR